MEVPWRAYVDPHNNFLVGSPSMGASLYIKYVPLTNKPAQSTDTISDESTQIRATLTQPLNRRFVQDCVCRGYRRSHPISWDVRHRIGRTSVSYMEDVRVVEEYVVIVITM
jgi:hypothetical protein